jgi:hypothetical protein
MTKIKVDTQAYRFAVQDSETDETIALCRSQVDADKIARTLEASHAAFELIKENCFDSMETVVDKVFTLLGEAIHADAHPKT